MNRDYGISIQRILRILQLIAVNSVPIAGVIKAGWSDATAISLYWCENVIFVFLIWLRLRIHRKLTNKRGHYVERKVSYDGGRTYYASGIDIYSTNFLQGALVLSMFEAIFLGAIFLIFKWDVDFRALGLGLPVTSTFLVAGFALDAVKIQHRSFAWISAMADAALWRVLVIFITIMAGMSLSAFLNLPRMVFIVFGLLKLYTDMARQLPEFSPKEAPPWLVRVMSAIGAGEGFAESWKKSRSEELARATADEEPFDGTPSGATQRTLP